MVVVVAVVVAVAEFSLVVGCLLLPSRPINLFLFLTSFSSNS